MPSSSEAVRLPALAPDLDVPKSCRIMTRSSIAHIRQTNVSIQARKGDGSAIGAIFGPTVRGLPTRPLGKEPGVHQRHLIDCLIAIPLNTGQVLTLDTD